MGRRIFLAMLGGLGISAGAALADPAVGTWVTPPDRKDLTSHIEIRTCGDALCATILRAFDAAGRPVQTRNIGRELFWDMTPKGKGVYDGGTVRVPLLNVTAKGSMRLSGNNLKVKACKVGTCEEFTWTRLN